MKQLSETLTEALKVGSKSKVSLNNAQTFNEFDEKYDCGLLKRKLTGIFKEQLLKVFNLTYIDFKNKYHNEGFSEYLAKPIDIKDLNKLMIKFFKKESR